MIQKLRKEDIVLGDWKFEFQQRAEQPILMADFFCRSLNPHLFTEIGVTPQQPVDYLFTDSDKGYTKAAQEAMLLSLLKEKSNERVSVADIIRRSVEVPAKFNAGSEGLTQALLAGSVSNQELADYWQRMDQGYLKVIPWLYYPWYISRENFLTDKVKVGLERHRQTIEAVAEFDEALMATVFPVEKTAFQLEQEDMLGLVEIAESNPSFAEDPAFAARAADYLRKYSWLTTFMLAPLLPMTKEQLIERVSNAVEESFKDALVLQKQATQKNEVLAAQIVEMVKDDAELAGYIADARGLAYALTAGAEEVYRSSVYYSDFMQLVAKRIGIVFERDMKLLLSSEIEEALRQGGAIPQELLDERRHGFVMMTKNGVQSALFGMPGHELSQWIDAELTKIDATVTELKGYIACKGFARGKARVALQPSQAHLLEEGDILVCSMTNPDYVPAMRRAGAIVTDEGGLLSHAAIMSREFGKPCVIATKIATQLIKTGDLVEVDAQTGVVRILQRHG